MSITTRYYRGIHGTDVYIATFGLGDPRKDLRTLDPRFDLRRFAPSSSWGEEFGWGSATPGAKQLALALLADALEEPREAIALSDIFLDRVISRLPAHEPWIMSDNIVRAFAASITQKAQVAA